MKRLLLSAMLLFTFIVCAFCEGYKKINDIAYRENFSDEYTQKLCKLDVYVPEGKTGFPTVVWFHGGGLTGGIKSIPNELKDCGIGIVAVNYRLLPKADLTDCIDDAAAAVAWTFKNISSYGGDTTRIYVAGHSAGGYLTDMIGYDKKWLYKYGVDANNIAGLFPFSGQVITHFAYRQSKGMSNKQPLIDEYAPLYYVRPDAPLTVIISGDRELEMLGRYEETAYFWRMLKVVGHPNVYMYELGGHDHNTMASPAFTILKNYVLKKKQIDWNR